MIFLSWWRPEMKQSNLYISILSTDLRQRQRRTITYFCVANCFFYRSNLIYILTFFSKSFLNIEFQYHFHGNSWKFENLVGAFYFVNIISTRQNLDSLLCSVIENFDHRSRFNWNLSIWISWFRSNYPN